MAPAEEPRTQPPPDEARTAAVRRVRSCQAFTAAIAGVGCLAFFAGRASGPAHTVAASKRPVLYYVDPMHPAYRSEGPGKAPDCGMDLVPVFAGGEPRNRDNPPFGTIQLTPRAEEAIQIRTEVPQVSHAGRQVRTWGPVVPDESRIAEVTAGVDGWVRRVFDDATGTRVQAGQNLAIFYSRDLSAPQQAYVYALESFRGLTSQPAPRESQVALAARQLTQARDALQFYGLGEQQIEELGRTGNEVSGTALTAPASGQILERNVAPGLRFMKGQVLYRIADLSRVWVRAQIYPQDQPYVAHVRAVRVEAQDRPPVEGRLARVPLRFDKAGALGELRIVVNNTDGSLVPGMIVGVTLELAGSPALTVHTDAVLNAGTKKWVFVSTGGGRYEPREVATGWQYGDRVEIKRGLKDGERVVCSGVFLLDSESRIREPHR